MATESEIARAHEMVRQDHRHARGLRLSFTMHTTEAVQSEWKHHFDERLLDSAILNRQMVFERDTEQSPWRFVEEVKQ